MFTDSHAHIFFNDFASDLDGVVRRATEAGVDYIISPGTDVETSRQSILLAEQFEQVYACVGISPHDAAKSSPAALAEIETLSKHPKVVAIGEIGLEYHYDTAPHDTQREIFSQQIEIAVRRDLPIVIHCREAEEDTLNIIDRVIGRQPFWRKETAGPARGVFHCFSGDIAMAHTVIDRNFFISVTGLVTFPSKPSKPNIMAGVVAEIPIEHILIETDSPYLAPVPFRGRWPNEPALVKHVAECVATLKQRPLEEIGRITNEGIKRLFGIGR